MVWWVKNQVSNDFVALYIIILISKAPVCYSIIHCWQCSLHDETSVSPSLLLCIQLSPVRWKSGLQCLGVLNCTFANKPSMCWMILQWDSGRENKEEGIEAWYLVLVSRLSSVNHKLAVEGNQGLCNTLRTSSNALVWWIQQLFMTKTVCSSENGFIMGTCVRESFDC